VGSDRKDADRGGQPAGDAADAVSGALGQEHRRAHSRRSVLHRRRKASLVAIDVASGTSTALAATPIVLRSFRLSPTGAHVLYVAPDPATLGIIGKEQNDTFVLPVRLAPGSKPAVARKLADRGRYSWSPDGKQLVFTKGGRLVVAPVEAGSRSRAGFVHAWRRTGLDAGWVAFRNAGRRPSVTDPELETVKPGMYTTARPFNDVYVVGGDGAAKNITADIDDQTSDLAWSADSATLYFRATSNKTYDETLYRYTVADGRREVAVSGAESYDRFTPMPGGWSRRSRMLCTHPTSG